MSSNTYRNDQLPPFFDKFLKHRILTRKEERSLALLTKHGTASYPVRFTVRNQQHQSRNCRTGVRKFHRIPTRFSVGISRPRNGDKVHGIMHFSMKDFGIVPEFQPHGIAIAIYAPRKREPVAVIPFKYDTRWGWYLRWNSKVVSNDSYRAVVHIPDSLALRATHELMSFNYRLVLKIARKYLWSGISLEDLFNAGVTGLQRGIERFDPSRGFRLNTYATWWIKQGVTRYCRDTSRTIRIPNQQWDRNFHIQQSMKMFGEDTDDGLIADSLSVRGKKDVTAEDIARTRAHFATNVISLDVPGENDSEKEFSLLDVIPEGSPDQFEQVFSEESRELLMDAVRQLTPREQDVITRRFGIGDDKDVTLDAIGKKFGVSRERVRQIETAILKKLRLMLKRNRQSLL